MKMGMGFANTYSSYDVESLLVGVCFQEPWRKLDALPIPACLGSFGGRHDWTADRETETETHVKGHDALEARCCLFGRSRCDVQAADVMARRATSKPCARDAMQRYTKLL